MGDIFYQLISSCLVEMVYGEVEGFHQSEAHLQNQSQTK